MLKIKGVLDLTGMWKNKRTNYKQQAFVTNLIWG